MTKEELLQKLQNDWYENEEKWVSMKLWRDAIIIYVEDNCDEYTTIDEVGNENSTVDWVLNHFDWNKPHS